MYGKVFDQIFDGTLYGRLEATAVFMAMIAIAGSDGVVDLTLTALTHRTGWPVEFVEAGIRELEKPDPGSRTPDEEGRRIVRLRDNTDWGWRIVNYMKYREIRDESGRRDYMRTYMQEYRRKQAVNSVNDGKPSLAHAEAEVNKKNLSSTSSPQTDPADVFEHWKRVWNHPKAVFDNKRRRRIEARLKDYTAAQLCEAISGYRNSPWHCGTDPKGNGTVYDSLDTLLQDSDHVETGLRLFANPPKARSSERPKVVV